jgi:SHS2 domain-containing protein
VAHTADWALEVWAPDMAGLLAEAAEGMYALCQVEEDEDAVEKTSIHIAGAQAEQLLVEFLAELVYRMERDRLKFDVLDAVMQGDSAAVEVAGRRIRKQTKEIKAVTYHVLKIEQDAAGLRAVVVFDV